MPQLSKLSDREIVDWSGEHQIGGSYSYSIDELTRLLEFVKQVPSGGAVCEVGVWYGRSASVYFLENARRAPGDRFKIHLIDSWVLNASDARPTFGRMIDSLSPLDRAHEGYWMPSQRAVRFIPTKLDLLHIDGDHDRGVWDDCRLYLPKVRVGGVVVIHDYSKVDEYPEVTKAVDRHITARVGDYKLLSVVGSQFAARRIA